MKPYFEEDGITIYHGDCRDILPQLGPVDVVITDPPYNYGKDYGTHNDAMSAEEYRGWCVSWFKICRELATRTIVFCGHGNLPMWLGIEKPYGIGCWYKPGNPAGGGVFQFCEWEPWLLWGGLAVGGSDVVRATISEQRAASGHPCPKPLPLFTQLITKTKATAVLDPFMGSGTTLVAAKNLGRHAIGIEIEKKYCEIAVKRLAQGVLFR